MNLPNKLTVLRMCMIPFFVLFMEWDKLGMAGRYVALALFIIASFTDMLDGKIARKYNIVTNFGKFMDPLADKLLVCAALICLTDVIPKWIVIIIISRELIISGFRTIAADNGVVIAASYWGKIKTVCQMIMIIWLILGIPDRVSGIQHTVCGVISDVLIYLSLFLTVISLVDYLIKNKNVLKESPANKCQ